ncbi:MAG: VOC family protein [Actinomycetota bacterium]
MADYIPQGSPAIVPYLAVTDGPKALAFYQEALGATIETAPMYMPDGAIGHAGLRVGDAVFMMSDAFPDMGIPSPTDLSGTTVTVMLYVPDCDAATQRFLDAGGELEMPPTDQFWGNRDSRVRDPFGHRWNFATQVEALSAEEIDARAAEFQQKMADGEGGH